MVPHLVLIEWLLHNELLFGYKIKTLKFFISNHFSIMIVVGFGLDDFHFAFRQLLDYLSFSRTTC